MSDTGPIIQVPKNDIPLVKAEMPVSQRQLSHGTHATDLLLVSQRLKYSNRPSKSSSDSIMIS